MGNSPPSPRRQEVKEDALYEEFSSSTTFGEVTLNSIRSTITDLTTSSEERSPISYEEDLRDEDDTYCSTRIDSQMYQHRQRRLKSRGEIWKRKPTSSDTHPFYRDAIIDINGDVMFNPEFGLDYTGKEGTRTTTARRRRRGQNSGNTTESEAVDTEAETDQGTANEADGQEKKEDKNDQQGEEDDDDSDDDDDDEEEEDDEDEDGNLGKLKFVHPLTSSLRALPTAIETARENMRPRQNSFSALGA